MEATLLLNTPQNSIVVDSSLFEHQGKFSLLLKALSPFGAYHLGEILSLENDANEALQKVEAEIDQRSRAWYYGGSDKAFVLNAQQEAESGSESIPAIFYRAGGLHAVVVLRITIKGAGIGISNTTMTRLRKLSLLELSLLAASYSEFALHRQILAWIEGFQKENPRTDTMSLEAAQPSLVRPPLPPPSGFEGRLLPREITQDEELPPGYIAISKAEWEYTMRAMKMYEWAAFGENPTI